MTGQTLIKIIPNDSLSIWNNLSHNWDVDTDITSVPIMIHGVSDNYEFPGWVPDKKNKNKHHLDLNKRIVKLAVGIYVASIMRSHSERYFLFCSGDSISLAPDYLDIVNILSMFTDFCKSEEYTDDQVKEYLIRITEWIKLRRHFDTVPNY